MRIGGRELIVVGDRALIKPDNPEERTRVGLVLPQTVLEKEPVHSGRVVATGPGSAIPQLFGGDEEPWREHHATGPRYLPLQVEPGDYALFLRKEAVEIRYRDETFLVVPQAAILLLIRGGEENEPLDT